VKSEEDKLLELEKGKGMEEDEAAFAIEVQGAPRRYDWASRFDHL
jgi:hypothetical protein